VGESLSAYSALPTVLVHGESSFNLPSSVPSGLTPRLMGADSGEAHEVFCFVLKETGMKEGDRLTMGTRPKFGYLVGEAKCFCSALT
jgi:hypothetical protein